MPRLNLYVSEDLASLLRREARRAGLSLSRYVVSLLSAGKKSGWSPGYFEKTCGFLREDFPVPDDRLPDPVEMPETGR